MARPGLALARRLMALATLLAALSGCGGGDRGLQRPVLREPPPRTAPSALPADIGAVWRLRAGLNVAALTCRGRGIAPVAASYSRLLSRHAALFARAYADEQRRQGVAGFDRAQTRLYNRMAYQRSPVRFCATAAGVAGQANAIDSPRLAAAAPAMVSELEAALR